MILEGRTRQVEREPQGMNISRRHMLGLLAAGVAASAAASAARAGRKVTNFNGGGRALPPTRTRVYGEAGAPPMLSAQSPQLMEEAIARYDVAVRAGGWPRLPRLRRILVAGSRKGVVRTLRKRLVMEGYLPPDTPISKRYDRQVAEAVMRFQRNHGLNVTGHVDFATLRELNVPAGQRLDTLLANQPRVEWAVKGIAERFILVNLPATQLESVHNGSVYSRHNVIVGKPERPSPSLRSHVSEINFNPFWTAPESIARRDIVPEAWKSGNPKKFLQRRSIRVFDGFNGPEVDPDSLPWPNIDTKRFVFRQDPGDGNAMATVKINFPNPYAVYMHDTPTKQLFTSSQRYFSSGCVRVEQVHVLTEWILRRTPGWDRQHIEQVVRGKERIDVHVEQPPNVIWAYLTSWVTPDGNVHFRKDIYRLDGTGFISGQPKPVRLAGEPG